VSTGVARRRSWHQRRSTPHWVTFHSASATIALLIFDEPRSRSVKVIGTSTTRNPDCNARHARSIWKQ
jgi:hypothetical protein